MKRRNEKQKIDYIRSNMRKLTLLFVFIVVGCPIIRAQEDSLLPMINFLRSSPQLFLTKYALPYIQKEGLNNNTDAKSLLRELRSIKEVPALRENANLTTMAIDYATYMGQKGKVGHYQTEVRFKKYAPQFVFVGENCSYGFLDALDILMQLLIDEGDNSHGHRKNLLNPQFSAIGIAIRKHKEYDWNCVMEFGGN